MAVPQPTPTDTRALRHALSGFATGVCVVTAIGPRGAMGITVNSFTSLSLDPPTLLWSLGRGGRERWPTFSTAEHFAVHVLDADGEALARRFAWGDPLIGPDEHEAGLGGVPLIEGWASRFECRTARRIEAEDHLLILGRIARFESRERPALALHRGVYRPIGEAPE